MNNHSTNRTEAVQVDYTDYESPSNAIALSIAAITDTDITELQPLFDSTDPNALNELFQQTDTAEELVVELNVGDHTITLKNNGELIISELVREK